MTLNPKRTKKLRQHFRNNSTKAEVVLWNKLKVRQLLGYKVRRQYGVNQYIIDFYCAKLKLGIELDGLSHYTKKGKAHDKKRKNLIANEGIKLVRIINTEVFENLDGVIEFLAQEFQKREDRW